MDEINATLSSLLNSLQNMREDTNCDCVINCGQDKLPAHRLVLSACSPYFREVLALTNKDESNTILELPEIDGKVMAVILDYMYFGVTNGVLAKSTFLQELVLASDFLNMADLFHTSIEYLAEEFSATNLQELMKLCLRYEADGLRSQILSHLRNKVCHLHTREDFLTLTNSQLKTILQYLPEMSELNYELTRTLIAWEDTNHRRKIVNKDCNTYLFSYVTQLQRSQIVANNLPVRNGTQDPNVILSEGIGRSEETRQTSNATKRHSIFFFRTIDGHSSVMKYDVSTDKWSTWKSFPIEVNPEVVSVVHRNHIYFMGGYLNKYERSASSIIHDYCLNMEMLTCVARLSFPVARGSAAVLDEQIYIVGGIPAKGSMPSNQRVQRYDLDQRWCEEVTQTNNKYLDFYAFSFKNCLYVADRSPTNPGNLEAFDPDSRQWTNITSSFYNSEVDEAIPWFNVAFSGSQMFAIGYYADSDLYIYDMSEDVWHPGIKFTDGPNGVGGFWSVMDGNKPILILQDADSFLYTYDITSSKLERKLHTPVLAKDYSVVVVAMLQQSPGQVEEEQLQHPLLSSLNSMRRLSIMTDVTLVCGQQEMKAHSIILTAALPYFRTMFSSGFDEAKSGIVSLPNIRPEVMDLVLTFLYTGKLCEATKLVFSLLVQALEVAHLMEIKDLYVILLQQVLHEVKIENFEEIYRISELYDNEGLATIMSRFLANNFAQFLQSEEFLHLSASQLKRILQHPELDITIDMKYLGEKLLQWCQYDVACREHEFNELMSTLSLDQLPRKQHSFRRRVKNMVSRMLKPQPSETDSLSPVIECLITWPGTCQNHADNQNAQVVLYDAETKNILASKTISFTLSIGMSAIGFGSFIYFFGGGNIDSETATNVYQYCPFSNSLVAQKKLIEPVRASGAGILGDTIYIISGDTVQRYVPCSANCEIISKTNNMHTKPIVFAIKCSVFVYSCSKDKTNPIVEEYNGIKYNHSIEQYNPLTDQWTVVCGLPSDGCVNSVALRDEIIYFAVTAQFIPFFAYGIQYGCCRLIDEYKLDFTYDFSTGKWSEQRRRRNPAYVKKKTCFHRSTVPEKKLPVGEDSPQQDKQVVFTDSIQSEFPYPLRVCPQTPAGMLLAQIQLTEKSS